MKKFLQLKSLLAIVLLAVGVGVSYADTYSYTFDAQTYKASGESVALGEATWTLTTDAGFLGYDSQYGKGQQIGSSKKPATTATLSTSQFADAEITSITVNTSGASDISANVAVKVGGTQFGESTALTNTATDYTFTGSGKGDVAIDWTNSSSKALYIKSITIEYTTASTSSVATPTFSVDPGTYGEKISVELACESEGAAIYYTLDGTTPDNTSTPYEAAIELNTKTTIKAIAYVGEEASSVATANYDFKLEGSLRFTAAPIMASTQFAKVTWESDDWANNTVNYCITYDGTVPSMENFAVTPGKGKTNNLSMYSWKKDTVVTVSIRPELDGIYGDTFSETFYVRYATSLVGYKAITEMAAGNYTMVAEGKIARTLEGNKTYGYLPAVAVASANNIASAYSYFEWTFEATDGGYYLKDSQGRYFFMTGNYNSFNLSETVPTAGGVWTVELQGDGTAKIMNVEKQKYIQYSTQYDSWGSYADAQGTMPVLGAVFEPVATVSIKNGDVVESLDKITFYCADGIATAKNIKYVSVMSGSATITGTPNQVDDNTVELVFSEPITEAGTYDLRLYKQSFTLAPNSLAKTWPDLTETVTFSVQSASAPVELVVSPASETYNKSLQDFTFVCEQGIYINNLYGGEAPFLGFTDPATGNASQIALTPGMANETSVTLSTAEPQTTEGYYTLVVPAEYFVLADSQPNAAIMNQYIVSAINPNAINFLSVTPEEGTVTELSKIAIATDTDLDAATGLTLTDANGNSYEINATTNDNDGDGTYNFVNVTIKETITADGTYTLTIPAGAVTEYLGSKKNDAQTYTWTIGGTEPQPTGIVFESITPEEGTVSELHEIIIITDTDLDSAEGLTLTDANGTDYPLHVVVNDRDEDGIYEYIVIRPQTNVAITAEGTYTLTIPAGAVKEYGGTKTNEAKTYTWTVGAVEAPDYIFSAEDYEVDAKYETLTDGIFTFLQGEESTKPWIFDENSKKFSNGHEATKRIKPQTDKNYITADVPATGKLVFGVLSSSGSATDRVLSVKQNDTELYGKIVCDANDKVDGVYTVHEVAVEQGLATITMVGALNFYYIEFVPGEEEEDKSLAITSITPADGDAVESFSEMTIVVNKEIFFDSFNGRTPSLLNAAGESVANMGVDFPGFTGVHQTDMGGLMLGKTFVLYCMSPITEPGNYQVVFYPNSFKTDDETESLPEFTVNFTIGTPAPAITATWSMEEGAVVESFESINITFAGEGIESAKAVGTYTNFIFYEKDAEGNYNHTANNCTSAGYMDTQASGTTVTFSLAPDCYSSDMVSPFNRKGEYRIVIPAGAIMFNGDKNNVNTEEYVLNFTIENDIVVPEEVEAAYTANPENNSTIKELKEVVITFTEYAEIVVCEPDFVMGSNIPVVSMTDPEFGMTMPAGYMMARAGSAANELVLYVDPMYTGGMESYAVAGAYTVTIPAGVVKFGNNINKAFTLSYTVEGVEQGLTVTASDPADGATVNKLESIVVDWSLAITVADASNLEATIQNVHGNVVSTLRGVFTGLAGNQIRYVLNTPVTENGIYTLVIPEGDVMDFDTETIFNAETTLTFTVDAPATGAPVMVESDPANGATVDAIESFTIVFNKPVVYDNYFEQASLQDKGGKVIANVKSAEYKDGDEETGSTTITFNLDNKVVEANTFVFVVPAKTIIDTYDWMTMMDKDINIEVTIAGSGVEDVIVVGSTPAANSIVQELSEITVEFNTGAAVLYMPNVVDESGKVLSATTSSYTDADGNTLADNVARFILTTPITNQGTVYLVIEAGSVYDYPNYAVSNSQEYRIMIEVTGAGINGIVADPVNGYVVYDLNGYRVMQTKKASDLERLNNGIYIINGVKVLLNK